MISNSNSPASSNCESHIENKTITIRPSGTSEKSYTIVVPANVRIKGIDMQLDLKIDQKALAAASDISRAINEVVSSVSSLPADSGRQAILRIPSVNSDLSFTITPDTPEGSRGSASISLPSSASSDLEAQSRQVSSTSHTVVDEAASEDPKSHVVSSTTEPSPMDDIIESGNIDDIQPYHGPTSTTEPMDQDLDDLVVSSSDNLLEHMPNTSTPETRMKVSVGTSFPETVTEPTSFTRELFNSFPTDIATKNTPLPSASVQTNVSEYNYSNVSENLEHESQPTTSSTVPTPVPQNAPKKKKGKSQAHSVVCEFIDSEKGQVCRQHALTDYRYCIRHILLDPSAPYKQCQHLIKPKHKKDEIFCTNPVKKSTDEIYCTTHLIKLGKKEPKKKKKTTKPGEETPDSATIYTDPYSVDRSESYQPPYNGEWSGGDSSSSYSMPTAQQNKVLNTSMYHSQNPAAAVLMSRQSSEVHDGRFTPHNNSASFDSEYGSSPYVANGGLSMDSPASSQHTPFAQPTPSPSTAGPNAGSFVVPPQIRRPSAPVPFTQPGVQQDARSRAGSVSAQPQPQNMSMQLSKQHPQLAAKLLQSPMTATRADGTSTAGHPPDGNVAIPYNQAVVMNIAQPGSAPQMVAPLTRMPVPYGSQPAQIPPTQTIVRTVYNNPPTTGQLIAQPMVVAASQEPYLTNAAPLTMINMENRPIFFNTEGLEGMDELTEHLKIQRDYLPDAAALPKKRNSISLHQKRQRIRMAGQFRAIPHIKHMCRVIEDYDFDRTDLFPLGLEPSDDEESSDDTMQAFGDWHSGYNDAQPKTQMELYLLKKQLRLEKKRLHKHAHMTIPVIFAAKIYPNSTGAALRARLLQWRRQSFKNVGPSRDKKCMYTASTKAEEPRQIICENPCLPYSNHCSEHIGYNIDQKMFRYCSVSVCGRPVLCADAFVTGGLCIAHFEQNKALAERKPMEMPSQPTCVSMNSVRYASVVGMGQVSTSAHYSNVCQTTILPPPLPPLPHQHHGTYYPQEQSLMQNGHAENSNDNSNVVEGDVSLASVANDLGFDGRELNAMLAELPDKFLRFNNNKRQWQWLVMQTVLCMHPCHLAENDEKGLEEFNCKESFILNLTTTTVIGDDPLENNPISVGDGFLGELRAEPEIGHELDHNWADIESFLLSEGYSPKAIHSPRGIFTPETGALTTNSPGGPNSGSITELTPMAPSSNYSNLGYDSVNSGYGDLR